MAIVLEMFQYITFYFYSLYNNQSCWHTV